MHVCSYFPNMNNDWYNIVKYVNIHFFQLVKLIKPKTVCVAPTFWDIKNLCTTFVLFIADITLCQQSLDEDLKGKCYCVYYDEGKHWGRLFNVNIFHHCLCIKGVNFCLVSCLAYTWVFLRVFWLEVLLS